ncbi:MAG: type II toxin-antitoxin system VapB family antitoxin [Nocardioidaceae bacterium]
MSLNIKNERVHELIRRAAAQTGQSQTSVVEAAVTRFLDDLDEPSAAVDRLEKALKITRDFQQRLSDEDLSKLSSADLYDKQGLPA